MNIIENEITKNADLKYQEFSKKIIKDVIVKVRAPKAKEIAKKYANTLLGQEFIDCLPHKSTDENNVHGFMLGYIKTNDVYEIINKIEKFLPYIDNWGTCDFTVSNLKIIKKYPKIFKKMANKWLKSKKCFIKRFAIDIYLSYFLDDNFEEDDLLKISKIDSNDYYVNMALAWYFSVALVKQYQKTVNVFIENKIINVWVHNKAIQKSCESYRINQDIKLYLKSLRR